MFLLCFDWIVTAASLHLCFHILPLHMIFSHPRSFRMQSQVNVTLFPQSESSMISRLFIMMVVLYISKITDCIFYYMSKCKLVSSFYQFVFWM
uniref:Uncharacterized protein n=1 Tax=Rhipicephalus zambeziensis TaxID=60191 RepID=A0A224Y525_9ACAR